MKPSALTIGRAGELVASAALEMLGYQATPVPNRKYDLLVDCGDRFLRVQVKATMETETRASNYVFKTAHGASSKQKYQADHLDVFACVALDLRRVVFVPREAVSTVTLRIPGIRFTDFYEEQRSWEACLAEAA